MVSVVSAKYRHYFLVRQTVVEPVAAQKRYTRKNCALIDHIQRDEILNSSGFSYVTIEGYHIVKNILVDTMRDVINNISQVLNLGVQAVITRV